jgi:hypothetical protein
MVSYDQLREASLGNLTASNGDIDLVDDNNDANRVEIGQKHPSPFVTRFCSFYGK